MDSDTDGYIDRQIDRYDASLFGTNSQQESALMITRPYDWDTSGAPLAVAAVT